MNFDLRIPIGLMFTIFGLILSAAGVFGGSADIEKSLGVNINLWWGMCQLLFGAVMLTFGLRNREVGKRQSPLIPSEKKP